MQQQHPNGLWVLLFGKMWDTFSYFGTQTILSLYLINIFQMDRSSSYLVYGAYAAFAFSAPTLGGIIADRWIGTKSALLSGCIFNITGNLMMIVLNRHVFCLGLATSLIGSGLYKSNAMNLAGALYRYGDPKKESGFTWFYLAINAGGALGPLVYGAVTYLLGWNYVFLFSALGIFIGGVWLIKSWKRLDAHDNMQTPINLPIIIMRYSGLILACIILGLILYFPILINPVIIIIFAFSITYILVNIRKYTSHERSRLFALFLLCVIGMFYFAAGLQTGSTITLFIQYKIQQGDIKMPFPGSTFNTLYCLFVIILAPFFTILWAKARQAGLNFSTPARLAIGIGLATLGIAVFALATLSPFILTSIIIGYLLLSAGELSLTPSVYTAISDLAPARMQSTMMGSWLLFVAIGSYFSSILANTSHLVVKIFPFKIIPYLGEFLFIALFTLIITVITTMLIPKLRKMIEIDSQ